MSATQGGLVTAWAATAQAHADKLAIVDSDGAEHTFSQLARLAEVLAASWKPARFSGEIIAIHLPNGARWLAHFLASQRTHRVLLPIDPQIETTAARQLARELGAAYFIDRNGSETFSDARPAPPGSFLVKLTSGSTGRPKALFFGEAEMAADARQIIKGMGLVPSDRHLAAIPLGHSYGLGNLVLPLVLQGATLVCAESKWPRALDTVIAAHQVTVLPLVPPLVRALAELSEDHRLTDSVRLVISAGAPLDPAVAQAFTARHGRPVHNFYGASETGGIAFDAQGTVTATGTGIGRLLPGVEAMVDADGCLTVRSAAVHRAPPGNGGIAQQRLNDRGCFTPEGVLKLLGRNDDMIKIGGRRISTEGVAAVLRTLPGVRDATVMAHTAGRPEPRLAALLVTDAPVASLQEAARSLLPRWQLPTIWRACQRLPYTARGKLDRAAVEQAFNQPNGER